MSFGPRPAHFTFWPVFSALLCGVVGDGSVATLLSYNLGVNEPDHVLSFPPGTNEAGSYAVLVQPEHSRWKISLLLLNMTCAGDDHISITSGSMVRTWCMNGTLDTFGNDTEVLVDGKSKYFISVNGGWDQSAATVLATLYRDPQDEQCQCEEKTYCCKNECLSALYRDHAPLKLTPSSIGWSSKTNSILKNATYPFAGSENRCIPDNLRCNGHPNCGLSCGGDYPDEDESFCKARPSEDGSSKGISFDKIMVYVIAVVGGGFGISFIIIFFAVYIWYRSKDWGVTQETFVSRSSLDFIHIDIVTNAYEFDPSTAAAIRRASMPKVLGFEHT